MDEPGRDESGQDVGGRTAGRGAFRRELGYGLISLILMSPATIPYLVHLLPTPGWRPTGFIQPDMAYYMANAREHFDNDRFQLFYGNPFSPSYETKAIYFQPMTLVLGLAWRLSGLDPGLI